MGFQSHPWLYQTRQCFYAETKALLLLWAISISNPSLPYRAACSFHPLGFSIIALPLLSWCVVFELQLLKKVLLVCSLESIANSMIHLLIFGSILQYLSLTIARIGSLWLQKKFHHLHVSDSISKYRNTAFMHTRYPQVSSLNHMKLLQSFCLSYSLLSLFWLVGPTISLQSAWKAVFQSYSKTSKFL